MVREEVKAGQGPEWWDWVKNAVWCVAGSALGPVCKAVRRQWRERNGRERVRGWWREWWQSVKDWFNAFDFRQNVIR